MRAKSEGRAARSDGVMLGVADPGGGEEGQFFLAGIGVHRSKSCLEARGVGAIGRWLAPVFCNAICSLIAQFWSRKPTIQACV